jgi:hypothetical protein
MNFSVDTPTIAMKSTNRKWVILMPDGTKYKQPSNPKYDLEFDQFELANYFVCNMDTKKKHKVRITMEIDLEVSTDYLAKLANNLSMEVVRNCFKNHNRTINSESMTIIREEV